ncbi:hypothetical protein LCGC14_1148150 [marine sediment metagenome]|uniref:Uncharacterized protein n=1 Tax=marine sediment metagenome TaxID=412755 RepID=A0A0F9MJL5_9ZZZZ
MTTNICRHIFEDGTECTPNTSSMHLTAALMAEVPSAHNPHPVGADCKCINGAWSCLKCRQWSMNTENQCRNCGAFRTALLEIAHYKDVIEKNEETLDAVGKVSTMELNAAAARVPLLKRIVELLKGD